MGKSETVEHTPGPWRHEWYAATDNSHRVIAQPGGMCIAECGKQACDDGMCAANARLLAAAPELLQACIVAMDWLADKGVDPNHVEVKRIQAAIAKAEVTT